MPLFVSFFVRPYAVLRYTLALVLLLYGLGYAPQSEAEEMVRVNRSDYRSQAYNETTLRTGNSNKHKVIAKFYHRGIPFKILFVPKSNKVNPREIWYRVQDFEGQTGWIRSDQLRDTPTALVINETDSTRPLYKRLEHGEKQATPLALLPHHYVVRLLACDSTWCHIETETAQFGKLEGYMARAHLWGDNNRE